MVEGAYRLAKGIVTIAGGITITGGGAALSATGVGSIIGAPAIAVSVPVVLAGAAELGLSGAVCANGFDNLNDNIKMASTDKVSEVSSSKQRSLNSNLEKINSSCKKVVVPKSVERVVKKLSPEAKKGYNKAIEALTKGDTRGLNEHPLTWNRSGQWAVDIKGMGRGRGAGRIIFTKNSDGTINIIEILTKHDY